jgi:transcription antitermination factor NusA-like protein
VVKNAVYCDGIGAKILLVEGGAARISESQRHRLEETIGGPCVIVEVGPSLNAMIASALSPAIVGPADVKLVNAKVQQCDQRSEQLHSDVEVRLSSKHARCAIGPGGGNVRAVQRLFGIRKIQIIESADGRNRHEKT